MKRLTTTLKISAAAALLAFTCPLQAQIQFTNTHDSGVLTSTNGGGDDSYSVS